MRTSEKSALTERLLSYMEYHPLPKEIALKKVKHASTESIVSEPFKVFTFNTFYVRIGASAFAVFLILSVPFIAERSLPGDVLYGVKVQFNEELRSTLALSPYAKVAWETQRLERRISEARLLASEGKLTNEAETAFAEAVKTHSDAAQRGIAELRESDSDEAAIAEITFASALAVQSEVLEGHIENNEEEGATDGRSVLALQEVVAQARNSAERAQTGTMPSYEKLLGRVELESTRVYELFTSVKKDASGEEIADIERTLADIKRKVAQAIAHKEGATVSENNLLTTTALSMAKTIDQTSLTTEGTSDEVATNSSSTIGSEVATTTATTTDETSQAVADEEIVENDELETEAVELLRAALTDIQKLLNYLTHIDVRENVSISDLVPVVPTAEERTLKIKELFTEIVSMQTTVASHDLSSKVRSKVSSGQRQLEAKLKNVTTSVEKGDLDSAESYIEEAYTIAIDLVKLTDEEPIKSVAPVETSDIDEQSTSTDEVVE